MHISASTAHATSVSLRSAATAVYRSATVSAAHPAIAHVGARFARTSARPETLTCYEECLM